MDDADRARAPRVVWSRVVLVVAALAFVALLILIVVGALTSGTTDEIPTLR